MFVCECGCGLLLGFGRQGRGFQSGSWFLGDVGLSPHLCFGGTWVYVNISFLGGCGFESTSLFFGGCGFDSTSGGGGDFFFEFGLV